MLRMLLDAQNAFRWSECFQMLKMLHRMFANASKWFGRFQSASEGFRMLQNATTKCLLNVSRNASPQDVSKCFDRFQNATTKGFECLFAIALECDRKMLQNKFVFFVNYSDQPILRILLGLTKKHIWAVYMIVCDQ